MQLRNMLLNICVYSSAKIDRKEFVSNGEYDNAEYNPIKIKFYIILVKSYIISSAKN